MRVKRTKLAPGVWQDPYGISIIVHTRHEYLEERHPLDTPLGKLNRRRETLRADARARALVAAGSAAQPARRRRTTLKDDVETYLHARAAMPTIRDRRRQLATWVALFGRRDRTKIAPHEIQAQRDAWLLEKKSAAWVNLHLRALSNVYRTLDPDAPNPVRRVPEVDEPESIPRAIPPEVVTAIFDAMQESKSKAHLRVIVATGIEQATFARLKPADVDLENAVVCLPRRKKGQGASARVLPLTQAGVEAFKNIERWELWGPYLTPPVYQCLKRACRRVERAHNKKHPTARISLGNLRPKDLRHTFGTRMSEATGGNVPILQMFLQHTTPAMSERYRMAAVPQHLRDAAAALGVLEERVGRTQNPQE
jgi:integrase